MCAKFKVYNMNINQYLKSIGKTKKDLANELGLSRPTLNLYIDKFENGKKIDNERYELIFKRLFSDRIVSKKLFDKKMDAVKYLLERDKKYDIGSLTPEAADIVASIHNIMVNDMCIDDWDRKVYETIIIILTRYRKDDFFRELSGYFFDLNFNSDLSNITEQSKVYYSCFYSCFRDLINNPVLNLDAYEAFLERRTQLSLERAKMNSQKSEKIKDIINIKIKEIEQDFLDKGIEYSEEEVLTEFIRRVQAD